MRAFAAQIFSGEQTYEIVSWSESTNPISTTIPDAAWAYADVCIQRMHEYHLTGWFFIQTCDAVAVQLSSVPAAQSKILWLLLSRAGFSTALFCDSTQLQVLVQNDDAMFNISQVQVGKVRYINLSSLLNPQRLPIRTGTVYGIHHGTACSFAITDVPVLPGMVIETRDVHFRYRGRSFDMPISFNRTYAEWLSEVPFTNYSDHIQVPLSIALYSSLQRQLQNRISSLSGFRKSEFLLAFIRTGFAYREEHDEISEIPLPAEQMVLTGSGDCEDRTALMYALAIHLLDVPVAVVEFEDHLGIALGIQSPYGEDYLMNGVRMKYCEPTDVQDVLRAGEIWEKYADADYRIFAWHAPE